MRTYVGYELCYILPTVGGSKDPAEYRVFDRENILKCLGILGRVLKLNRAGDPYALNVRIRDFLRW